MEQAHRPDTPRPGLGRRCLAEAIAAFALVFAGCGAVVADAYSGGALGVVGVHGEPPPPSAAGRER